MLVNQRKLQLVVMTDNQFFFLIQEFSPLSYLVLNISDCQTNWCDPVCSLVCVPPVAIDDALQYCYPCGCGIWHRVISLLVY